MRERRNERETQRERDVMRERRNERETQRERVRDNKESEEIDGFESRAARKFFD